VETTSEQIRVWLFGREDEHLEFKAAEESYSFDAALKYCCAIANERGGRLILGVKNKPREIVGTKAAYPNWQEDLKLRALQEFRFRIDIEEQNFNERRLVIIHIPSRPIGMPLKYENAYWMRSGESLVSMSADQLQRIFAESQLDFSAEVCPNASFESLDKQAIARLRTRWHRKSGNDALLQAADEQLLADAELVLDGKITYAALVLLGSHAALGRFLGQAEIIFEYRANEASIPFQDRRDYREGFFCFDDELWQRVNLRNEIQHYEDGLFVWDIPAFDERIVREALLNAISHRDYRLSGSITVRQYPQKLVISSPGGFPDGVNAENILWQQIPRNRRIAELLSKCGLVERSGQGANIMFERSIKNGKPLPNFGGTDDYQVCLTLGGQVQDVKFLRFLERVGREEQISFSLEHLLAIDCVHQNRPIPVQLRPSFEDMKSKGIVEVSGRGRGVKYILSRRFYSEIGDRAAYTRLKGLDRKTIKELIVQHLVEYQNEGCTLQDILRLRLNLTYGQARSLLQGLKREGRAHAEGTTRGGRWFPGRARI